MQTLTYADRVSVSWSGTGDAATFTPGSALPGFRTFAAAHAISYLRYIPVCIQAVNAEGSPTGQWETGVWEYDGGANTLTRVEFHASSTGSVVSFSAGTKHVWINFGAEAAVRMPKTLTQNLTLYVSPSGDDYVGLGTGGSPYQTIQRAVDEVATMRVPAGKYVTISVADGTYDQSIELRSFDGAGYVRIVGNTSSPGAVVVGTASSSYPAIYCWDDMCGRWEIQGMELVTSGGDTLIDVAGPQAYVTVHGLRFGACTLAHVRATDGALVKLGYDTSVIVGNAASHLHAARGARIYAAGATTNVTGRAFTQYAYGEDCASMHLVDYSFIGTATGKRYTLVTGAVIRRSGTNLPGNAAGTASTTQYV